MSRVREDPKSKFFGILGAVFCLAILEFVILCFPAVLLCILYSLKWLPESGATIALNVYAILFRYVCPGTLIIYAAFLFFYKDKNELSKYEFENLLRESAEARVNVMFSVADVSNFEEDEIDIAKGYFEVCYLSVVLAVLEQKRMVKKRFIPVIAENMLTLHLSRGKRPFSCVVYSDVSTVQEMFEDAVKDFGALLKQSKYGVISSYICSIVGSPFYIAVNSVMPVENLVQIWRRDAIEITEKIRVEL